jgi:hypothetical protein
LATISPIAIIAAAFTKTRIAHLGNNLSDNPQAILHSFWESYPISSPRLVTGITNFAPIR